MHFVNERVQILLTMKFTVEERTFIVKRYFQSNPRTIINEWDDYFHTNPPTKRNIFKIVKKFEATGSVHDIPKSSRPTSVTTLENMERVATLLVENPRTSSRRGNLMLDVSHSSYRRLVKKLKFKVYTPRLTHALMEDDPDRRLQFCELMLNEFHNNDQEIFSGIVFSDEAQFKLNGLVNRHNSVYYDTINPHISYEKQMNQPGVLVWAGLSSFGLFGPYFFEKTENGQSYLEMLKNYFIPGLKLVHGDRLHNSEIYFQHDGAPAHYAQAVRNYLDEEFEHRVIGRRGCIEWPPRSPDLTPLDFFLWGYVKDKVYSRTSRNLEELKSKIEDVFIDLESNLTMLKNVFGKAKA